jgi:hypothetical protein
MYVVDDKCLPRHIYLRRVTLDTYLEYGQSLYANEEDEEELMKELVDTTTVSGVSQQHHVRYNVDYVFMGRAYNKSWDGTSSSVTYHLAVTSNYRLYFLCLFVNSSRSCVYL